LFRFLLVDRHGQPVDPAALVTAVPNWSRVLAAQPDIDEELIEQGFNGTLVVEPMDVAAPPV
jgi:hypothetical protein